MTQETQPVNQETERFKAIANLLWLAVSLLSAGLTARGHDALPITEAQIFTVITTGSTILSALACWWKNQNWTEEAVRAQVYKNQLTNQNTADN